MSVKLLTEHHFEFLSLKGGCIGSTESTHIKIPHCWKSHVAIQFSHFLCAPQACNVSFSLCLMLLMLFHRACSCRLQLAQHEACKLTINSISMLYALWNIKMVLGFTSIVLCTEANFGVRNLEIQVKIYSCSAGQGLIHVVYHLFVLIIFPFMSKRGVSLIFFVPGEVTVLFSLTRFPVVSTICLLVHSVQEKRDLSFWTSAAQCL